MLGQGDTRGGLRSVCGGVMGRARMESLLSLFVGSKCGGKRRGAKIFIAPSWLMLCTHGYAVCLASCIAHRYVSFVLVVA